MLIGADTNEHEVHAVHTDTQASNAPTKGAEPLLTAGLFPWNADSLKYYICEGENVMSFFKQTLEK